MRLRRYEDNAGSSDGYWLIAGREELVLWHDHRRGWRIGVRPSDPRDYHVLDPIYNGHAPERAPYLHWLKESRLEGQLFESRRQALEALQIAMEIFPLAPEGLR